MNTWFRLGAYWFVMTAALGVYFPYFSLYLKDTLAFTGAQIGLTFAVAPCVGMLAQPFWGRIADRSGSRSLVLAGLSAGTAAGYALLAVPSTFAGMLLAVAALSFFSTAQIPMAVAVSLAAIAQDGGRVGFGRVRVWGTLGFFVMVLGVPVWVRALARLQHVPEREVFHAAFALAAGLAALASCVALSLPRVPMHERVPADPEDLRRLRRHRPYWRVLFVSFSAYLFLQGAMVLFPVYVRSRGGTSATISYMWTCMLMMETMLMLSAARLHQRFGTRLVVTFGVLACAVRWVLCAFCGELAWVYPVQVLHGVFVVGLSVSAPLLVESLVPARVRASSQAGLNLCGPGLGGILSSTLAGFVLDAYGIDTVMLLSGCAGLLLAAAAPFILPSERDVRSVFLTHGFEVR